MTFPPDLIHFEASEFEHPDKMDVGFLRWLDRVRERAGVPFHITNDFRTSGKGLHGLGMAVDLDSRQWNAAQKWRVNSAIVFLAHEAPGAVEFEPVYDDGEACPKCGYEYHPDRHFHLGIDPRPGAVSEFIEADD